MTNWHFTHWKMNKDNYLEFVSRTEMEDIENELLDLFSPAITDWKLGLPADNYTPGCSCERTTSSIRSYERADSGKIGPLIRVRRLGVIPELKKEDENKKEVSFRLLGSSSTGLRLFLKSRLF